MASKHDDTRAALNALGAPYNTGSLSDAQLAWLRAKAVKTTGSIADLQVSLGLPVRQITQSTSVVLP